jgi:hypothetical protein
MAAGDRERALFIRLLNELCRTLLLLRGAHGLLPPAAASAVRPTSLPLFALAEPIWEPRKLAERLKRMQSGAVAAAAERKAAAGGGAPIAAADGADVGAAGPAAAKPAAAAPSPLAVVEISDAAASGVVLLLDDLKDDGARGAPALR